VLALDPLTPPHQHGNRRDVAARSSHVNHSQRPSLLGASFTACARARKPLRAGAWCGGRSARCVRLRDRGSSIRGWRDNRRLAGIRNNRCFLSQH
jgi:hypothetical protein